MDTLYSCGYTDGDLESNEDIEIYLDNKARNILSFKGNKFMFRKNKLFKFEVRINDIKKFKKYEFSSFYWEKLKFYKNGFIKTVKLKENEFGIGVQCEYFMIVENNEKWKSLTKQYNVLYISKEDIDIGNDFIVSDLSNGFNGYKLRMSKDKQLFDMIIAKIELFFKSKIDKDTIEDTGFGMLIKDNKDNIFLYDDDGNLVMWYNNIIRVILENDIWKELSPQKDYIKDSSICFYNNREILDVGIY